MASVAIATAKRRRTALVAGVVSIAAVAALAFAPAALGAVGDLTPLGCIDDEDTGADVCATSGDGLDGAQAVAVSPDGKSVYVVSDGDEAISRFRRSVSTGELTYKGCIAGAFSPATCADTIPGNFLLNAVDVAVAPDGKSVYVVSRFGDSGVYNFKRDTTTGELTFKNCVGDDDVGACAQNMAGIDEPTGIAISPDGDDVYLADFGANAIAHLRRNTTNGNLIPKECVIEDDGSPNDPCGQSSIGLAAADSVAVSPDGKSLYAVGAFSDAIVHFNRNTGNGVIHPAGCISDPSVAFESCAKRQIGMGRPEGVAVSPDGNSVYVTGRDSNTLVRFDRAANGGLKARGCFVDNEFPTVPCGDSPKGLTGAHDLAISPDGESLYVVAQSESAVTQFDRDPSGVVLQRHCTKDNDQTADYSTCPLSTDGLGGASDVAVSPDGKSVYATSDFPDNAVVAFSRDTGP
jgi:DNA-binding beta-propeller fold protein YncE